VGLQRRYAVRVANRAVRVGVDVTPLLGSRTGVGQFVGTLVDGFTGDAAVELCPFTVSARGWRSTSGKTSQRWPMPARPLRALWRKSNLPPIEWWTGSLDVVHGTNFVVPPSKRAVQLVSVHDMTTVRFPELCTPDTLQYPGLIARAVARGAHIHTDSVFVANEVIDHFAIERARVHTIHLGLPAKRAVISPCTQREAVVGDESRYVLAIGTVEPRKDYPTLLRAFGLLAANDPDLRLVIVGQSGWGERAFGEALALLPSKLSARIDRLGFVDEPERIRLLAGASLLVYPSVYEGFGLPPLEAMAAGIPVVATAVGSLPEVLGVGARFVPPANAEELAEAIHCVLSDSTIRAGLVSRGFEKAAQYTTNSMISRFSNLYVQLGGFR
jgi:glycosyltransferase involved in cell wall biosynthesis